MELTVGAILEGKIKSITNFGAFVSLPENKTGMVHISEVSSTYVKDIKEHLKENQTVKVKVLSIGEDGKISLSIKRAEEPVKEPQRTSRPPQEFHNRKQQTPMSFEDMMNKFKQTSDEKMSDLKRSVDSKRGGFSRRGSANSKY